MVADARLGFGTLLQRDTGSGMTTIARMVEIGEFGPEADDVDVTHHESDAGHREFIRGLVDDGEIAFTAIYVGDTTQTGLMADILEGTDGGTTDDYQIVIPGGYGTFEFSGYVKNAKLNPQMDGRLEMSGVLKISGQPAFATTASTGLTTPFFVVTPDAGAGATYVPARSGSVYDYAVTVGTTATAVTVTPTASAGVIKVNGNVVATGVASSSIALGGAGSVTVITVTVKETNKTSKQYILRVVRP